MIAETDRLILREFTPGDAPRVFEIYSDAEVMRFMGPPPASVEEEARSLERHAENCYRRLGYGLWAVVEKGTGDLIGRVGLLPFDLHGEPRVELCYLLRRASWGQGYATEAAAAAMRFAFDTLRLDRLYAVIAPANAASVRVVQRLGFRADGTMNYKQFGIVDLYRR